MTTSAMMPRPADELTREAFERIASGDVVAFAHDLANARRFFRLHPELVQSTDWPEYWVQVLKKEWGFDPRNDDAGFTWEAKWKRSTPPLTMEGALLRMTRREIASAKDTAEEWRKSRSEPKPQEAKRVDAASPEERAEAIVRVESSLSTTMRNMGAMRKALRRQLHAIGVKGGHAAAASLTAAQRRARAKKAAKARWAQR